jgi:uncharacterized protein YbjT (DUF2867 family)
VHTDRVEAASGRRRVPAARPALVTGATGNAGGAVVRALVRGGQPVRALVRTGSERATWPAGVEQVAGDLNRPESLRDALDGVGAVFLLSGYQQLEQSLAEMRQAGVERVVLLSSSAAPSGELGNAVACYHILSERAVRDSGLRWTFLQPNSFMSNTLRWKPQLAAGDVLRLPFADVRIAMIDPDDLGAVAAVALTSGEHDGRVYRLSGPESLLPEDQVRILASVLGRVLRFEPQSDADARVEMGEQMPAEYADAFFEFFADGRLDESRVLPTVEEVTGRRPGTFEQWARAHVGAFS